jgi:hemerythrin-like metal-binding protein
MSVEWDESYSVGIDTFDNHHKKLFELLNGLSRISDKGETGSEVVSKTLKELLNYTEYHFGEEEKALGECGHSDLHIQKEEHEYFANKVKGYCTFYLAGTEPLAMDVVEFLHEWLSDHIKEKDRNYEILLRSKGVY